MKDQSKAVRWGILGCGRIARKLVNSMNAVEGAEVVAAASNTPGKADAFCQEHGIGKAYKSYKKLLSDRKVDVVYIANTHNLHCVTTIAALKAGKHVLCEKPLAVNAEEARQMVEAARKNKVFLMEAMWTRFLPAIVQVRKWLEEGRIGDIKQVHASFGVPISENPRIREPELAGGALLDLGIYPLSFVSMVMQAKRPVAMQAFCELLETGVDASSIIHMKYPGRVMADVKCSCIHGLPNDAWIIGSTGSIHVPADMFRAEAAILKVGDEEEQKKFPLNREESFSFQIEEVNQCIRDGLSESSTMPLNETILLAELMDALRAQWGVRYPGE